MQNDEDRLVKLSIKSFLLYVLLITFMVFISSWQSLSFHFWKDDWIRVWMTIYRPDLLLNFLGLRAHPGTTIEEMFFGPILGLNPFYWQIEGLFLKILASLSVGLMILATTHSRKIAYISSLFFATCVAGIESFNVISAHAASLTIIFFGVGFYYWTRSFEEKNVYSFICSLPFLIISFLISPARAAAIPILIMIWDLLTIIRGFHLKDHFKIYLIRWLVLLVSLFLAISLFKGQDEGGLISELIHIAGIIINQPSRLNNFFASIGNLFIGWIIPLPETAGLSYPTLLSVVVGFIFFIFLLIVIIRFFKKRTLVLQNRLFFLLFIYLGYLPNWWFYSDITVGTSYRYLTLSLIGLSYLISSLVSSLSRKYFLSALLLVLGLNIILTNLLLSSQLPYRSIAIVNHIWDQIDTLVPKSKTDNIFLYTGEDPNRFALLDWSLFFPFAIRRNLTDVKDFPILVHDRNSIQMLLCGEDTEVNTPVSKYIHRDRIPLSHLYAFRLEQGNIINESTEYREYFKLHALCSL